MTKMYRECYSIMLHGGNCPIFLTVCKGARLSPILVRGAYDILIIVEAVGQGVEVGESEPSGLFFFRMTSWGCVILILILRRDKKIDAAM